MGDLLRTYIRVPPEPVPVMAEIDGERVQVGTGTLDKETGVFTTTFFNTEPAKKLAKFLQGDGHYSLPVQYSQVEALTPYEIDKKE